MRIVDSGVITHRVTGTDRAVYTFPALLQCRDGRLLMTCRRGSNKDSADEWVELYPSTDGGRDCTPVGSDFPAAQVVGAASSFRLCYLTEMEDRLLLAASLWIDRETHPGAPLFNSSVDRIGSGSICARIAADACADFDPASEVVIYTHGERDRHKSGISGTLDDMSIWSYGLPYAETLDNGDVMVVYHAGDQHAMDIHFARLSL